MAAVGLPLQELTARLAPYRDLHVAAVNAPSMATVAGDVAEIGDFCSRLTAEGAFVRRLPMAFAYHSPHMNGLQAELSAALTGIAPRNARLAFFSTVSGRDMEGDAARRRILVEEFAGAGAVCRRASRRRCGAGIGWSSNWDRSQRCCEWRRNVRRSSMRPSTCCPRCSVTCRRGGR